MPRFRGRSLNPVNSVKRVVDIETSLAAATNSKVTIVTATEVQAPTSSATACPIGATISSFFLSVFMLSSDATTSGFGNWYLIKLPGKETAFPNPGATGLDDQVRFIFHEEKAILSTEDGTAMGFKGVIKIPPRFKRVGRGDEWAIVLRSSIAAQFCIKAIYKYYQ